MTKITYRQLEVFLAVCEGGSFRGGADRLCISEAAVSNHIAKLETGMGSALFERGRGIAATLTERGIDLQQRSEQLVHNGRSLVGYHHSAGRRSRQINIHVAPHLLDNFVRPALPDFHARYCMITLNFVAPTSRKMILQGIDKGAMDIAVLTVRSDHELPGSSFISDFGSGLYAHPDLVRRAQSEGLQAIPFILSPEGTNWGVRQIHGLRRLGVRQPIIAARTPFFDVAINMALAGLGAIPQFDAIIALHDKNRTLCRIYDIGNWHNRILFNKSFDPETYSIIKGFFSHCLRS